MVGVLSFVVSGFMCDRVLCVDMRLVWSLILWVWCLVCCVVFSGWCGILRLVCVFCVFAGLGLVCVFRWGFGFVWVLLWWFGCLLVV